MFSLDQFHRTYDTVATPVRINDYTLNMYTPASIDRFIDSDDVMHNFPLWAKLWEASAVLANYLATITPDASHRLLEIGCGLGLVGIVAARSGHRITMTDIVPDALNFARANALVNGCPDLPICRLDWNAPDLDGRFDCIVGSETVYRSEDIDGLEALFDRYLDPGGTVILAESVRSTGVEFWNRMNDRFQVQARRHTLTSEEGQHNVLLFRLRHKSS
jgi:predicted nicotinamide N-methyase